VQKQDFGNRIPLLHPHRREPTLTTGGTNAVISLAVAFVSYVWRRNVGKLADGNREEAKRARLIEQLTNFTVTVFHVEHAKHS
jgi:hypothetical protein